MPKKWSCILFSFFYIQAPKDLNIFVASVIAKQGAWINAWNNVKYPRVCFKHATESQVETCKA